MQRPGRDRPLGGRAGILARALYPLRGTRYRSPAPLSKLLTESAPDWHIGREICGRRSCFIRESRKRTWGAWTKPKKIRSIVELVSKPSSLFRHFFLERSGIKRSFHLHSYREEKLWRDWKQDKTIPTNFYIWTRKIFKTVNINVLCFSFRFLFLIFLHRSTKLCLYQYRLEYSP